MERGAAGKGLLISCSADQFPYMGSRPTAPPLSLTACMHLQFRDCMVLALCCRTGCNT